MYPRNGRTRKRTTLNSILGIVGLALLAFTCTVNANPPDEDGNHNHGGGGGGGEVPPGTIYFTLSGQLHTMNGDGANKAPVPGDVHGEPSHALHGDQRWYLEVRFIADEFYPDGGERRELFAVTEAGDAVQLTDQADLEPVTSFTLGATRWAPGDAFVSWVALRWDPISGMPVDAGVYVAEVDYDAVSGNVIGLVAQPLDPMVPTAFVEDFDEVWRPLVRTHDWSPDQTAIVYDTVDSELFTADTFTGDSFVLTNTTGVGLPVWSPDGSKIAFQVPVASIATINPDGSGEKIIIKRKGHSLAGASIPGWSPTGEHLIYRWHDSTTQGGFEPPDVYRAAANGGGKTNLTADLDGGATPIAWR